MTVVELVDAANPSTVYDTVTFDGGAVIYDTGDARPIVESRQRLIADPGALVASFDGWSNGYVATRIVPNA